MTKIKQFREKKGKSMELENNLHVLEDWILEILLRLPVKSLSRFKCVSKSWFLLISDPNFAKTHFELSVRPSHRLICHKGDVIESVDLDAMFCDYPPLVKLVPPHPILPCFGIVQSCRGFILLDDCPYFILWNPSTGANKRISYSHILSNLEMDNLSLTDLCGFGYDASKDDYLIVVAWHDENEEYHFEFFSLRTKSWTKFDDVALASFIERGIVSEDNKGSFLNGAIHWFVWTVSCVYILTFDMIERRFSEIRVPRETEEIEFPVFKILGGYLIVCYKVEDKMEVWIMKEYKVQSSWTRYEFDKNFEPIYVTKCGDIIGIIYGRECWRYVKYNDKGELLERRLVDYDSIGNKVHTESLLSLPGDSGEAGEDE